MADRVFLRGIALFARHGVLAEETRLGQRFQVDVDCFTDTRAAGASDEVADAVNYQAVFDCVREIGEGRTFKLIEALAEAIAARLLEAFPALNAVRVEVRKPSAPIDGILDHAGVAIERRRGGAGP